MVNSRRLFDGLMLVIIGAVLLLNSIGVLPWSIWLGIWRFWPLLLIAAGLSLVLNRAVPFMGLLCLALVIILAVSWYWPQTVRLPWEINFNGVHIGDRTNLTLMNDEVIKPLPTDATKPFSVDLTFRAGQLYVGDTTDQAFDAKLDYYGTRPAVNMDANNDGASLSIKSVGDVTIPSWFGKDKGPWETWNVALNPNVPLKLTANLSAFDADLDLSQYNLTGLHLDASAGDLTCILGDRSASQTVDINSSAGAVKLTVGNAAKVTIAVSASAGSVDIHVPAGAALRVREHASVSSTNVAEIGLTKSGDYWVSSDYDAAAQKIDIDYNGSASSLRITR